MDINLFDYNLPDTKIAKFPPSVRGESRLMIVNRDNHKIEHKAYADMANYFRSGDVLVINNTRVEKQRVRFTVPDKSKPVELLFLYPISPDQLLWDVKVGNARALKSSPVLKTSDGEFEIVISKGSEANNYQARFLKGNASGLFNSHGETPIPPYLHRPETPDDQIRYNTVFAKQSGSVAAPTASLNMTENLLSKLKDMGVIIVEVTLDVNWGTFAPVKTENLLDHKIHSEHYTLSKYAAYEINLAKEKGMSVWALGTTVARVLETCAVKKGRVEAKSGWTEIFIYPGYNWQIVDRLITNFHTPKSTLLALVSAFANRELILKAYEEALAHDYKFLSYGDSMLII